jgi:ribosomal protein S18 acetylase RimI-like enzyme
MHIRTLQAEDARAWWDLRREALQNDPRAFGKTVEEHESTSIHQTAEQLREKPESNFTLGAFDEDRLVGIITFLREAPLKRRHKGHVVGVYVSPSHRRRGLGEALMTELIGKVRRDHPTLEILELSVAAHNGDAGRLYRRFGFTSFGIEQGALKVDGEYIDEEHMWVRLA